MKDVITEDLQLLFGDCLERMKEIPDGSVDMILTDPPYNIAKANNFHTMGRTGIDFGGWDKGFDLFSGCFVAWHVFVHYVVDTVVDSFKCFHQAIR